ncbi:hypothetical protein LZ32DRAFT_618136 [Colletotrichum eremochloae]|nr:hypothetical protein LZ32DRAFT_618136 [Colletotrichum eremochloae]
MLVLLGNWWWDIPFLEDFTFICYYLISYKVKRDKIYYKNATIKEERIVVVIRHLLDNYLRSKLIVGIKLLGKLKYTYTLLLSSRSFSRRRDNTIRPSICLYSIKGTKLYIIKVIKKRYRTIRVAYSLYIYYNSLSYILRYLVSKKLREGLSLKLLFKKIYPSLKISIISRAYNKVLKVNRLSIGVIKKDITYKLLIIIVKLEDLPL